MAASSFTPSGRLAGAHSRDYDYLFGLGGMATYLRVAGLAAPLPGKPETPPLPFELSTWRPDAAIRELAARTPRTVVSMWGEEPDKVRVLWTGKNTRESSRIFLSIYPPKPESAYFIALCSPL